MTTRKKTDKRPIKTLTIRLGYGLPGAGKTTYLLKKREYNSFYVEIDKYNKGLVTSDTKFSTILDKAKDSQSLWTIPSEIILDGMFVDENAIANVITHTKYWLYTKFPYELSEAGQIEYRFKVIIDYWVPDVEICIFNDILRNRESKAEHTIKSLKLNYPSKEDIAYKVGDPKITLDDYTIEVHNSVKADVLKTISEQSYHYNSNTNEVRSETWNSRTEAPVDFDVFDEILFVLKPDIPYLLYKKIWKECKIYISHNTSSDYYSNYVDDQLCYVLNLDTLREVLEKYHIL